MRDKDGRETCVCYKKDGAMRFDGNGGSDVNYEPNSFGSSTQDSKYVERPKILKADPAYGLGIAKGLGLDIKVVLASDGKLAAAD